MPRSWPQTRKGRDSPVFDLAVRCQPHWKSVSHLALQALSALVRREGFLPHPTTKEWGEDRGEGPLFCSAGKAPPLPGPLLHSAEERGSFRLRLDRAVLHSLGLLVRRGGLARRRQSAPVTPLFGGRSSPSGRALRFPLLSAEIWLRPAALRGRPRLNR